MNKKICFITLGNLYLCPYISKYISLINCKFDVIYWDRHGVKENVGANQTFAFQYKMEEGSSKLIKLVGYLKFKKYVLEILKRNNYDGIILLQTSVGILLRDFLEKKYNGKYIVDIRDYTMENNRLFYMLESRLIKKSAYTIISSKGFENFLPKHKYVLVHNDNVIDNKIIKTFENKNRKKDKIVISYIGLIRFHDQNKKVILKFKNDKRFKLRFIGKDAFALKEFCNLNNVNNVELIDQFPPEKTIDYYFDTDIVYNLYGNNTPLLDYALSNKLYYAAKLKMPILVCPNTFMEKVATDFGIGFTFNLEKPSACDDLYDYYRKINWETFFDNCERFVDMVNKENKVFYKTIHKFIEGI